MQRVSKRKGINTVVILVLITPIMSLAIRDWKIIPKAAIIRCDGHIRRMQRQGLGHGFRPA